MPTELLLRLTTTALPCPMTDPDEIETLRNLRSRGLVVATFTTVAARTPMALVVAITPEGQASLRRDPAEPWQRVGPA